MSNPHPPPPHHLHPQHGASQSYAAHCLSFAVLLERPTRTALQTRQPASSSKPFILTPFEASVDAAVDALAAPQAALQTRQARGGIGLRSFTQPPSEPAEKAKRPKLRVRSYHDDAAVPLPVPAAVDARRHTPAHALVGGLHNHYPLPMSDAAAAASAAAAAARAAGATPAVPEEAEECVEEADAGDEGGVEMLWALAEAVPWCAVRPYVGAHPDVLTAVGLCAVGASAADGVLLLVSCKAEGCGSSPQARKEISDALLGVAGSGEHPETPPAAYVHVCADVWTYANGLLKPGCDTEEVPEPRDIAVRFKYSSVIDRFCSFAAA